MGILDRLEKIASGFLGAAQTPFGFGKDLITAPFVDDDIDGFINTIKTHWSDRWGLQGQFATNLIGPNEGIGAAIGALPENEIREPAKRVFDALEWVYNEGSERYSTVVTAAQGGDLSIGGFKQANVRVNQVGLSPGQAVSATLTNTTITDDAELEELRNSKLGNALSGGVDLSMRLYFDPTVMVAKGATAARLQYVTKPIKADTDLDKVMGTARVDKYNKALEGKSAAEIRDQFFPNDVNGAAISTALADAGDYATRARVLRLAMGDTKELDRLRQDRADLAGRLERLTDQTALLRSLNEDNFAVVNARTKPQMTLFDKDGRPSEGVLDELDEEAGAAAWLDELPSELERAEDEIRSLYDEAERLDSRDKVFEQMRNVPRYKLSDAARVGITRSQVYQKNVFAKPVAMVFNMRPNLLVDVNDPVGDVNVQGYLRKAGHTKEEQDVWRNRYMAVSSPEGRSAVLLEMEDVAIERLARENGLSRSEFEKVMKGVNKGRGTARQIMSSRAYDGEGRSLIRVKGEDGVMQEYPLWVSQTANVIPLGDIEKARKAITDIGKFKRDHPSTEVPTAMLDTFTRYWKPSVLLRPGWPIRVVTDEQMRIMAKVGVLAQLKNLKPGIENMTGNAQAKRVAVATRGIDETTGELMTREKAASLAEQNKIGFGTESIRGYEIEKVFGDDVNNPNAAFELTKSRPAFARLFADAEKQELDQMQELTKDYRSISPTQDPAEHGPAWVNAVNRQIAGDPLGRLLLSGGTYDDAMKWLRSPEGRAHLKRLPMRAIDLDGFVRAAMAQVDSYTLGDPTIMEKALKQQARMDDLVRIAPNASQRPVVHGGVLDDALGKGPVAKMFDGFIERAYTALGSLPSDALSRHPYADHMYRAEATRMIAKMDAQRSAQGQRLTFDDLELVKARSREYAISQTRKLLYDMSEQSDMAGALRFISPFYSAWQEVMVRWAGIAIENPAYVARVAQVWHAPERAGIITDENGNEVSSEQSTGDTVTYPDGTIGTIGKERYVTLSVPSFAKDVIGLKGARTQDKIFFNKKSFNMILQGNPGFGVPVQIPVNEIVKDRPDLADSVKMILPFGPNQNSLLQAVLPAAAKRIQSRQLGEEDDVFRNAALRIYSDMVIDHNLGKTDVEPTWEEAMKRTKSFYAMRAVASYVLPAAPGFKSPYQPYLDAHRRLRAQDPLTADQKFLDIYGPEFFAITQSFSRSADGVPPTVEGFTARSKYKDLIEASPELGSLIIGSEGAGEFANAVYQYQKANKVSPGSLKNQRNSLTFEEVAAGPNTRLGWIEYRKLSDMIDAERIDRGLPNLQVKAAQDLALVKTLAIQKLADKYPEWHDAFSVVDRKAQEKRLVAMRAIAYDPRMAGREDMKGLRVYFDARKVVREVLEDRKKAGGSAQLDASSNQDVALIWAAITGKIVEKNLAFSDTYYRYLERDDLTAA